MRVTFIQFRHVLASRIVVVPMIIRVFNKSYDEYFYNLSIFRSIADILYINLGCTPAGLYPLFKVRATLNLKVTIYLYKSKIYFISHPNKPVYSLLMASTIGSTSPFSLICIYFYISCHVLLIPTQQRFALLLLDVSVFYCPTTNVL